MMTESEAKRLFATYWLKHPDNPFKAASLSLFPFDPKNATWVVENWAKGDPEVERHKRELLAEHGAEHFLPSKAELAREVWDTSTKAGWLDPEVKIKGLSLFADVMGHKSKGEAPDTGPRVAQVLVINLPSRDPKVIDAWEAETIEQQRKLLTVGP